MMEWHGIERGSTPIMRAKGEALDLVNSRLYYNGEIRRRKGMARSSLPKKNASVTKLSGFSAFQDNVFAALTDGDRLQGYQNPYALWSDIAIWDGPNGEQFTAQGYDTSGDGPETTIGYFMPGDYVFTYISGAVQWRHTPDVFAATLGGSSNDVILQIFVNYDWQQFSYSNDNASSAAASAALAHGKTFQFSVPTMQLVKLRYYDQYPGPTDNVGSVTLSISRA